MEVAVGAVGACGVLDLAVLHRRVGSSHKNKSFQASPQCDNFLLFVFLVHKYYSVYYFLMLYLGWSFSEQILADPGPSTICLLYAPHCIDLPSLLINY